jgi:hypothetical protein
MHKYRGVRNSAERLINSLRLSGRQHTMKNTRNAERILMKFDLGECKYTSNLLINSIFGWNLKKLTHTSHGARLAFLRTSQNIYLKVNIFEETYKELHTYFVFKNLLEPHDFGDVPIRQSSSAGHDKRLPKSPIFDNSCTKLRFTWINGPTCAYMHI